MGDERLANEAIDYCHSQRALWAKVADEKEASGLNPGYANGWRDALLAVETLLRDGDATLPLKRAPRLRPEDFGPPRPASPSSDTEAGR
jgi:hypothetical protein